MPAILDKKGEVKMTACDKAIYWVLVVSNTLSGLIYGLFTAFWYKQIRVLGKPPE